MDIDNQSEDGEIKKSPSKDMGDYRYWIYFLALSYFFRNSWTFCANSFVYGIILIFMIENYNCRFLLNELCKIVNVYRLDKGNQGACAEYIGLVPIFTASIENL